MATPELLTAKIRTSVIKFEKPPSKTNRIQTLTKEPIKEIKIPVTTV